MWDEKCSERCFIFILKTYRMAKAHLVLIEPNEVEKEGGGFRNERIIGKKTNDLRTLMTVNDFFFYFYLVCLILYDFFILKGTKALLSERTNQGLTPQHSSLLPDIYCCLHFCGCACETLFSFHWVSARL